MKPIKPGDYIPDFSSKDQDGNLLKISNYLGKKKLVIFLYPKDGSLNSTTCNRVILITQGFNNTFYADKRTGTRLMDQNI
jgi:peroxiredoxin